MMKLIVEPLTAAAFAPFGQAIIFREDEGREVVSKSLISLRSTAAPHLALTSKAAQPFPLVAERMERHRFSSQTFLPLNVARYLVLVAPDNATGGPDPQRASAFTATGRQGVIYAVGTWHYPSAGSARPLRGADVAGRWP